MARYWGEAEWDQALQQAESAAIRGDRAAAVNELRRLGLDRFVFTLWRLPDPKHPALSRLLPDAPTVEQQMSWTGAAGATLLGQTLPFVRSLAWHFERLAGARLEGCNVLDYGCGYGRLLRVMEYFVAPDMLFGCDAWANGPLACRQARVQGDIRAIPKIPDILPFDGTSFDLVYAFSVFTHLSPPVMKSALGAIRRSIAQRGVLAITIRPPDFWQFAKRMETPDSETLLARHDADGVAFVPLKGGDGNYGDTTMSLDFLARAAEGWRIAGTDWNHDDQLQRIVYLQPI